jgi:hypothetical protein
MGLLNHFTTEWPLVKAAPWPFAEALLAALVALTPFLWWVLSYLKSNQLANKDAQISLLQTQLNEYREKLKVGSPDEALKKLAQLEKRTARNLTDEQQRTIQSAFEDAEPSLRITILYYRECFDCADYARRIRSAFPKDADVSLADFSGGDYGNNKHELLIGVSDATKPPPLARKLAATLSKAQLPNSFVRGIPSPRGRAAQFLRELMTRVRVSLVMGELIQMID